MKALVVHSREDYIHVTKQAARKNGTGVLADKGWIVFDTSNAKCLDEARLFEFTDVIWSNSVVHMPSVRDLGKPVPETAVDCKRALYMLLRERHRAEPMGAWIEL